VAIDGSMRANRYYFLNLLRAEVPTIPQISKIGKTIHRLNHAQWESNEDAQFREWVNEQYQDHSEPTPDSYYDTSPVIGIDAEFGKMPPGYFILPEYFTNSCIVFPESTWQNDELAITEKALKCFYAGSLPFPIGGSNINQLYNDLGFFTAWNLLPDDLKLFDQQTDHVKRYTQACTAINWLNKNCSVFETDQFNMMVAQNRINFLINTCSTISAEKIWSLITTKLNIDFSGKL
jgi:hypothetical protein